ncbi:hypothetical protein FHP25_35960 [Vineibacter terrae]|uniref:Uncharacterized protein n=1 Tax=Vineibacter terrae TaxID=2586908 RepID=A0A5C8P979_9HYPH|nr:hypothetical protein [Vineibacter terrae]TXL70120.1 hypothetical protein FHP25_35960 [Vineibacter terrae]
MGENGKVWLIVAAIAFAAFVLGSFLTPSFEWCSAGPAEQRKTHLGFTCDAWIQSISQLLGGVATLIAVVMTLNHGKREAAEESKRKLAAIGYELAAVEHVLRTAWRNIIQQTNDFRANKPGRDILSREYVIEVTNTQPPITTHIFATVGAEVSHLPTDDARAAIEASASIREWTSSFRRLHARLTDDEGTNVGIVDGFALQCFMAARDCARAVEGIERFTGLKIAHE